MSHTFFTFKPRPLTVLSTLGLERQTLFALGPRTSDPDPEPEPQLIDFLSEQEATAGSVSRFFSSGVIETQTDLDRWFKTFDRPGSENIHQQGEQCLSEIKPYAD